MIPSDQPPKRPLAARFTYFLLLAGVGGVGAIATGWVMPVLWCLAYGGLGGLRSLTAEHLVFPAAPAFLGSGKHADMFMSVDILIGLGGFVFCGQRGLRYWRRMVVSRGWLTEEQAKYFSEQDEGF